jgi:signal transduction histidine kinase/uncharacterized protein YigA (DUF484 family)
MLNIKKVKVKNTILKITGSIQVSGMDTLMVPPTKLMCSLDNLTQQVAEISTQLAIKFDLDELLENAVFLIQRFFGFDETTIYLLDSAQQEFTLQVNANVNQPHPVQSYAGNQFTSLPHRAVRRRAVICMGDMALDEPGYYRRKPLDIRSELHIPLFYGDGVLGVLSLGSMDRYTFDNPEVMAAFKFFSVQLASYINRSFQQIQNINSNPADQEQVFSQVAELRHILPEIQSLTGEMRDVFDKIVRSVVQTLGYPTAMLAVVDEKKQTLTVQAIAYSQFMHRYSWDMIEKMLEIQIIGSTVSLVEDKENLGVQSCLAEQTRVSPYLYDVLRPVVCKNLSARIQESTGINSCISVPLKVNSEVVGVLCAGVDNVNTPVTSTDRLHFLAINAAIAIKNSTHFTQVSEKLLQREVQLKQLRRIDRILNGSLELEHILESILYGALELTQAEAGEVILVGKYATDLIQRVSYPEKLNFSGLNKNNFPGMLNTPGFMTTDFEIKNSPFASTAELEEKGGNTYSLLAVPITLEDELVAAIRIISHKADAFTEQTQDTLEQLAVQAAIAIKNAYQFKLKQAMQQQLTNVAQVAAMGDMASNMVHSINNWVGAIRADLKYMFSLFEDGICTEPEEINELLSDMLINAESTLDMAKNIKKPFQPSEKELIDVNECIRNVLQEKQAKLPNIVRVEDLNQVPSITATRQLELVFENLINNALQAMEKQVNGVLKLETRLSKDERWVEIIVQDSGDGLPKHLDSASIFRLGVSGRQDGLGYGLWWSDTFLKRWGGEINVEEHTKRGCKFLVRLPVVNSTKEQAVI